jgi:hypothetical protein
MFKTLCFLYHETRSFQIWGRLAAELIVPKRSGLQNSDEVPRNGIGTTQKDSANMACTNGRRGLYGAGLEPSPNMF